MNSHIYKFVVQQEQEDCFAITYCIRIKGIRRLCNIMKSVIRKIVAGPKKKTPFNGQ